MPNKRQKGIKLAGAYIPDEKDEALAKLAEELGFKSKADYIRALIDAAIENGGTLPIPSKRKKKSHGP